MKWNRSIGPGRGITGAMIFLDGMSALAIAALIGKSPEAAAPVPVAVSQPVLVAPVSAPPPDTPVVASATLGSASCQWSAPSGGTLIFSGTVYFDPIQGNIQGQRYRLPAPICVDFSGRSDWTAPAPGLGYVVGSEIGPTAKVGDVQDYYVVGSSVSWLRSDRGGYVHVNF